MRVTNTMQNIQLLRNLRNNYASISQWQDRLATGQRIQKPADDPIGIGYLMRYNSELNRSDEFLENARTGLGYLDTMDALMQQVSDVFKRAKTLAQQASTGTTTEDARKHIAAEIKQLKGQLIDIGNSSYNGRYLFNGQQTDQAPYTLDSAATDTTDQGVYYLNVNPNVSVPVSLSGEQIFGEAGSATNAFKVMDDLIAHLESNNFEALTGDMENIEKAADRLGIAWAEIGARTNRFELVESRILDNINSLKKLRSETGDVDMADAIIELKLKEGVLQASLSTGARIMQVSLIDYIR